MDTMNKSDREALAAFDYANGLQLIANSETMPCEWVVIDTNKADAQVNFPGEIISATMSDFHTAHYALRQDQAKIILAFARPALDREGVAAAVAHEAVDSRAGVRTKALEGENAALREAVKPFVRHYQSWMDEYPDGDFSSTYSRVTFGQLRAARAALAGDKA